MKSYFGFILTFLSFLSINLTSSAVIPAVIKIYDEDHIKILEEEGVEIMRRRGDILLCLFPGNEDEGIVIPNSVRRMPDKIKSDYNYFVNKPKNFFTPALNHALNYYNASSIQSGDAFGLPYTGKGILVGFCDIGLDPLHPTFLDENGNSRIKKLTHYKDIEGERIELEGDIEYQNWITDNPDAYHATHVGGILAGNGGGSQYVGVARDADIVASVSELSDYGLLMGVEDIIDYAKSVGQKAVINLSMGSYTGAHDGSSLFSQYLDLCADDAIIVLSAGNEGSHTNTLAFNFSDAKDTVEFKLGNKTWDQKKMYGITDIWNSSENPLTLTIHIYDDEINKIIYSYNPILIEDWNKLTYEWDSLSLPFEDCGLEGYLTVTGGIDPENGRYNVALYYDFNSTRQAGGGWARDIIKISVTGTPNDDVEIFADGSYTRLIGTGGSPLPSSELSISDLACGERVISVGMYCNNPSMQISEFSSYGSLRDGRDLPLTVAPGYNILSACNRVFADSHHDFTYSFTDNIPWVYESGTSMSSPYVAGYIATWLEAVPELTVEDIKYILAETNRKDIPDVKNPRNPNGYFDPVEGLRLALKMGGVTNVPEPDKILNSDDQVEVYSLSGILVYKGKAEGCNFLQPSFYVIKTPFGIMKHRLPGLTFHK